MNNPIGAIHSSADVATRGIRKIKSLLQNKQTIDESNYNQGQLQRSLKLLEGNNQVITTASDRVAKIVQSLRAFARLDEAVFQKADLHENIDTTLTLIDHELRDKATVIKEYGQIPQIHCYPSELNQVWMNLLRNAVQAIEGNGTIKIATSSDDTQVYIRISDTGKGIPTEDIPKIFNPGFTTKNVGVGTGLGLSIVYNIIQKHHGDIKVKSEIGNGTEFTIVLPIEQSK
jgi:signal transduction histidine kinase